MPYGSNKNWKKKLINKLGLNWAKLSSNWNWALLQLRFAALHWWLQTIYHYISLSTISLCHELPLLSSTTPCHTSLPPIIQNHPPYYLQAIHTIHRPLMVHFKLNLHFPGGGGAGIIRLKANSIHIYLPTGTELPKDYHLARMLPTGHIWSITSCISTFPGLGWVGGGGNNQS